MTGSCRGGAITGGGGGAVIVGGGCGVGGGVEDGADEGDSRCVSGCFGSSPPNSQRLKFDQKPMTVCLPGDECNIKARERGGSRLRQTDRRRSPCRCPACRNGEQRLSQYRCGMPGIGAKNNGSGNAMQAKVSHGGTPQQKVSEDRPSLTTFQGEQTRLRGTDRGRSPGDVELIRDVEHRLIQRRPG